MAASMNSRPIPALCRCVLAAAALAVLALAGCGGDDDDNGGPPPYTPDLTNVLRIDDAAGTAGETATVTFQLENTSSLTGLQFDFAYDASRLGVASVAAGSRAAGFDAEVNEIATGVARVILVDLDGTARIAPGDGVVATVSMQVATNATGGASSLLVTNATAVDAGATTVSIGGSSATFTVR